MIDPLEQTKMTDFITDNGYEWAFLYFRALMFNETYAESEVATEDAEINTAEQMQFVKRYWGSIVDYIVEIDYDYLGELFEEWCNDEAEKLILPKFTDIKVIPTDKTGQLLSNSIYLCTEPNVDTALVNELYAGELAATLAKVNKVLQKKALFSEFQQGGDEAKIHQYERWLDAALLADMLTFVGHSNYDRLGIFIDLITTDKPCWKGFRNTYSSDSEFHTMKFRADQKMSKDQVADIYNESNYDKTDLKNAFDRIGTYVKQGRGLIQNVATGKMAGVR